MADVALAPPPVVPYDAYWNGAPPPHAFSRRKPTFWSRPKTWVFLAVFMLALTGLYFLASAAGSLAAAPGGCGGG